MSHCGNAASWLRQRDQILAGKLPTSPSPVGTETSPSTVPKSRTIDWMSHPHFCSEEGTTRWNLCLLSRREQCTHVKTFPADFDAIQAVLTGGASLVNFILYMYIFGNCTCESTVFTSLPPLPLTPPSPSPTTPSRSQDLFFRYYCHTQSTE